MSIRSIANTTRTLFNTADKVGAKIPTKTKQTIEQQLELAERINAYRPATPALSTAVVDALARDVDPLTDPAVLQSHLAEFIRQLSPGFPDSTNWKIHDAVVSEWPTIMAAIKVPYNKAGEQLREAHEKLTAAGVTELTMTAPSNSETLAVTWVRAHDASRTINDILNAVGGMAVNFNEPRYISDTCTYDTHGEPTDHRFRTAPWAALGKGWSIDLATPDEYDERMQAEEETKRRYAAQLLEQQKSNNGRNYKPIVV